MNEKPDFIDVGHGDRLFVVRHDPGGIPRRAVIVCHPLGEEKLWAHRVLVSLARDLAARGAIVVRFDFRGEGESSRRFEETDVQTRVEDLERVLAMVRAEAPSLADVVLFGVRFGGLLAAAVAARRADIGRLVVWDPVVDGEAYLQGLLRVNLTYQMAAYRTVVEGRPQLLARLASGGTVNIEGYEMHGRFYTQGAALRLGEILPSFAGRSLLIDVPPAPREVRRDVASLAGASTHCQTSVVSAVPFWKETRVFCQRAEALTVMTAGWLEQQG